MPDLHRDLTEAVGAKADTRTLRSLDKFEAPDWDKAPKRGFDGRLDEMSWGNMHGWVWFPGDPTRRAEIEVIHDGKVIQRVKADIDRPDVREAGYGDGNCGFIVHLPKQAFTEANVLIGLREASSGLDVPGSPYLLINDEPATDHLKMLVAAEVNRLMQADGGAGLPAFAAFLLTEFDRLSGCFNTRERERQGQVERWAQTLAEFELSDIMQGLLSTARHRYGNDVLAVPTSAIPKVSIIIPVHGKFWYTYQCLASVVANPPETTFEIIVVDDGSQDETLLGTVLTSGVRFIRKSSDRGFVASVNAGVAQALGEYVFLLNNDTEVKSGWLDELVDTIERDPAVGVVGSKLVFPNGSLQEAGGIIWRQATGWNIGRDDDPSKPEYNYLREADYVSGAALLLRRRTWDAVGGLSDEFKPAYYEDTDLCFKVRALGLKVVVQPYSLVVHHEGVSAGTDVGGSGMKRFQAINQLKFSRIWADVLANHPGAGSDPSNDDRFVPHRVLFIDESAPTPDRDAGSNAAYQHMMSLQRCGYQVHFVPADNMARIPVYTDELERRGIRCYYAPHYWSVEEVLRKTTKRFDAVYIHRLSNARKYISLIRQMLPKAGIIYNVADLHHVRMLREAALENDAEALRTAREMATAEFAAVRAADVVITHSASEQATIAAEAPGTHVCVIPWTVEPAPTRLSFEKRQGVAFVGSYNHTPNQDAVVWLVSEIMPRVWAEAPEIKLTILGSGMDKFHVDTTEKRLEVKGWVQDIVAEMQRFRLSVAPLRYGAGLKGKVLTSYSAEIPCVGTTIAAEGASIPEPLSAFFTDTPENMAALIVRVYRDPTLNAELGQHGLAYIRRTCSGEVIDSLLQGALSRVQKNALEQAPVILPDSRTRLRTL